MKVNTKKHHQTIENWSPRKKSFKYPEGKDFPRSKIKNYSWLFNRDMPARSKWKDLERAASGKNCQHRIQTQWKYPSKMNEKYLKTKLSDIIHLQQIQTTKTIKCSSGWRKMIPDGNTELQKEHEKVNMLVNIKFWLFKTSCLKI